MRWGLIFIIHDVTLRTLFASGSVRFLSLTSSSTHSIINTSYKQIPLIGRQKPVTIATHTKNEQLNCDLCVTTLSHHLHCDIPNNLVLAGPEGHVYIDMMPCGFVASITLQPRVHPYSLTSEPLAGQICFRGHYTLVAKCPVALMGPRACSAPRKLQQSLNIVRGLAVVVEEAD